ncbi:NAD(P)H-binding protein [Pseudonocardia spinosispora]|uniref:NAD(P)H-binding protein n=1 Tax=Pseudonocardia spinosispora TaxID=103441 RepID=UPI0003F8FB50|nr:NAD(P)H-binding protein [Pseudonocardia spinosispora]
MRVVIAGGHGKIALRLERLLAARGDEVIGLVRNPDHVADVTDTGASAEVLDLESGSSDDLVTALEGADAVVFAAGAGPGSGAERKDTVDRAAAVLLADAAVAAGVPRYILISSPGVDTPPAPGTDEVWAAYLVAKKAAEVEVAQRSIALTVLRPGPLTDDEGTGRVALAPPGLDYDPVPRQDVAAVLAALLTDQRSDGLVLDLMAGDTPIDDAVDGALS